MAPVLLFPFIQRPVAGIVLAGLVVAFVSAWYSPALALALVALPSAIFALTGGNPFPPGVVTAIFSAWITLAIGLAILRGVDAPPLRVAVSLPVVASAALLVWMAIRLGSAMGTDFGGQKVQLFVAGNLMFLVAGIFVGWRRVHTTVFLGVTMAVALAGALVLLVQLATGSAETVLPDRYAVSPEDDPIGLSRESAYGILIAAYFVLSSRWTSLRLFGAAALPALAIALIAGGSRGPVVGLAVGLAVFLALGSADRTTRRRLLLLAVAAAAAVIVVPQVLPNSTISRSFEVVTDSGTAVTANGRIELWERAYDALATHPLQGLGTGGFARLEPLLLYPHNLLLETWAELGLVGFLLLVAFLGATIARLSQAWRGAPSADDRLMAAAIAGLFSAALVNAMFSGAIQNNRSVWLWAGLAIGLAGAIRAERDRE